MYFSNPVFINNLVTTVNLESTNHNNPSPRLGLQDLLVTHYDCEDRQQKALHKNASKQVT